MIVATLRRYSDSPGPIAEVIEQVCRPYGNIHVSALDG